MQMEATNKDLRQGPCDATHTSVGVPYVVVQFIVCTSIHLDFNLPRRNCVTRLCIT